MNDCKRRCTLTRTAAWPLFLAVGLSVCSSGTVEAIDLTSSVRIIADLKLPDDDIFPLRVNRDNRILAPFSLRPRGGTLLFYSPDHGISVTGVPEDRRVTEYEFGNWGAVLATDNGGGQPLRIVAAEPDGSWQAIFEAAGQGTASGIAINDQGTIAFVGRDTNHHGNRDAYRWHPDAGLELLPDLEEESLGEVPLVDGLGRITLPHLFLEPEYRFDVYRHDPNAGWSLILPYSRLTLSNTTSGWSVNDCGNLVVPSHNTEGNRLLHYFEPDSDRLVDLGRVLDREVHLADNGDILLARRRVQRADGTRVEIASLLPNGYEFPYRPQTVMNNLGELWIEATRLEDGSFWYFFSDGNEVIRVMEGLPRRLQYPVLSDDGNAYFWLDDGAGAFDLATVPVPEPGAFALAITAALLCRLVARRRAIPAGRCLE